MSDRPTPVPVWWKNTFFWIAGILFVVGIIGLPFVKGPEAIRDPGQVREGGLVLIYWGGAIVMLVNGWLSHRQAVNHYIEEGNELPSKKQKAAVAAGEPRPALGDGQATVSESTPEQEKQ